MTLSEIKREVRALKRKYAAALAVVRLRRAAREFCDEWEATREEKKPTPNAVETDQWFYIRGFRLKGHHFFMDYINRCKKTKEDPSAHGHRQGPHALAVVPPHHPKPDPPRVLLRAPSGSQRPHQPPRPRTSVPDHDLEPPQPGTHTRITRYPYDPVPV